MIPTTEFATAADVQRFLHDRGFHHNVIIRDRRWWWYMGYADSPRPFTVKLTEVHAILFGHDTEGNLVCSSPDKDYEGRVRCLYGLLQGTNATVSP